MGGSRGRLPGLGPRLGLRWKVVGCSGVEQTRFQMRARDILVVLKVLDTTLQLCQVLKGHNNSVYLPQNVLRRDKVQMLHCP